MTNTPTIKEDTQLLDSEAAREASEAANGFLRNLPKQRIRVRRLLQVAFHVNTGENEAVSAFLKARACMATNEFELVDMLRGDWGGGPVVKAVSQVGHLVFPAGSHKGKTIAQVSEEDPTYFAGSLAAGWKSGPFRDALVLMRDALTNEVLCRFTGNWDDDAIVQWEATGF